MSFLKVEKGKGENKDEIIIRYQIWKEKRPDVNKEK
jgi:hypothetical protein